MNEEGKKDKTYKLHIGPAVTPDKQERKTLLQKFHTKKPKEPEQKERAGSKVWSTLRFISTAAIIFIILFFAMNWNAYQMIILNKLGFLKPATEFLEEQFETLPEGEGEPQELLELSKDPEVQKSQIPPLALDVSPPDTRIVIPRISKNVPVITISTEALVNRDWGRLEQEIQEALHDGVVHYPGTAFPGDAGNIVVTGHSSYFVWDPGRFKDVFALLHDVRVGDKIYMYYKQDQYTFEVFDTKIVLPTQVDILTQEGENRLTLITCTPVGTNLKRLVVLARPV